MDYELGWNGVPMSRFPYLAFDTETEVVDLTREVPRLACLQVTNGQRTVILRPGQVAGFLEQHRGALLVAHNAAFDLAVLWHHLKLVGRYDLAAGLQEDLEANRIRDTMLLDFLVRLACPLDTPTHLRGLDEVARQWLGRTDVDKQSPWRQQFHLVIEGDWDSLPREAWDYAARDAIATHAIYAILHTRAAEVDPRIESNPHGPLTECLQLRATVALDAVTRRGFAVDPEAAAQASDRLSARIDELIESLEADTYGLFRRYKVGGKWGRKGDLVRNKKTGVPQCDHTILRERLVRVIEQVGFDGKDLPRTARTGQISTALDPWVDRASFHPFVRDWAEMMQTCKLRQFLLHLTDNEVHARYRALVRTGRTSCSGPNVQQIPRVNWMRGLFRAREGRTLAIVDYSAIELVTLAAVCQARFRRSVLADTLRSGRDPHAYTAALMRGMSYEEFLATKKTDPDTFKSSRQAAKAVNFGVPGGLGADKLANYAKANYGVDLSLKEAENFRNRLVRDIYPELSDYLRSDPVVKLAGNLGRSVEEVREVFRKHLDRPPEDWFWIVLERLTQGRNRRQDGNLYADSIRAAVWDGLAELTAGHPLHEACAGRRGSDKLWRALTGGRAVTLTGRVRAGLRYTEERNTPFQALAADGAKVALYRLWREGYVVVAFIHDEIVCEVPLETAEEDRGRIEAIMIESMASVLGCDIPVKVEGTLSPIWTKG